MQGIKIVQESKKIKGILVVLQRIIKESKS